MVRKVKVTKKVAAKVPWYERPPLLFGAIAAVLLVSGILMAHLTSRTTSSTQSVLGGDAGGDSLAPVVADTAAREHLLTVKDDIPAVGTGELLPPLMVETLQDAATARHLTRDVRGLESFADAAGATGVFGFVAADNLLDAFQEHGEAAGFWDRLPLHAQFDPDRDIEVHRDDLGAIYLAGFVAEEVGEALGTLGPTLPLPPAPEVETPPAWQFWKKRSPPETTTLYEGKVVSLHTVLNPEAKCFVVLPLQRARPEAVRTIRAAMEKPRQVLQVALH